MTGSIFAVQILTDYLDRVIALALAVAVLQVLPQDLRTLWKRNKKERVKEEKLWEFQPNDTVRITNKNQRENLSFTGISLRLGKVCILRLYRRQQPG